ncbi:MAG: porin family protein [Prevotella sp.]|nr:porin family protein [Prevotella sp.]
MSQQMEQRFSARMATPVYLTGYEEHEHHERPLSVGVALSYPLTQRFSISTGIVYTRQKSTFTHSLPSSKIVRSQTLHYVGVPLNVQLQWLKSHGLTLYTAAGIEADFNAKATVTTDGVRQETDRDRLQWSVGASLGAQYSLTPQIALYAEPGLRHYPDNGSATRNYYKEQPTEFNIQLGIRFTLDKQAKQ